MTFLLDLFFVLTIFEGAIRKWIYPSGGVAIEVFRDVLPSVALMWARKSSAVHHMRFLNAFIWGYIIIGATEAFNPNNYALVAMLGMRTHFAYIPLLYLMPKYLGSIAKFKARSIVMLAFGLPIVVLAYVQSKSAADAWINLYASGQASGASFGTRELVRATGTFAYITGMSVFCQFLGALAVGNLLLPKYTVIHRVFTGLSLACAVLGALSTGSRGSVFSILVEAAIIVSLSSSGPDRRASNAVIAVFGGVLVIFTVTQFGGEQYAAFVERNNSETGDVAYRLASFATNPIAAALANPVGNGIGTGHQQAGALVGGVVGFGAGFEDEASRVAFELGIPGLLAFVAVRIAVLLCATSAVRRAPVERRPIAAVAWAVLAVGSVGSVYTPIANAFYWAAAGTAAWAVGQPRLSQTSVTKQYANRTNGHLKLVR